MRLSESNISLHFPDHRYFRFQDCEGYKKLSGYHFKEMDACWYDIEKNTCWLFELKDFSVAVLEANTVKDKVLELMKKSVDSLAMITAIRHSYASATQLTTCLPEDILIDHHTTLKFISIIHCSRSQRPNIQLLREQYKDRFKAYATLFNINTFTVMDYESAKRGSWIPHRIVR